MPLLRGWPGRELRYLRTVHVSYRPDTAPHETGPLVRIQAEAHVCQPATAALPDLNQRMAWSAGELRDVNLS